MKPSANTLNTNQQEIVNQAKDKDEMLQNLHEVVRENIEVSLLCSFACFTIPWWLVFSVLIEADGFIE